jgi:hypothetical protein
MSPRLFPLLAALLLSPRPAPAQLRPLDPAEWRVWDPGAVFVAGIGAAAFGGQRASLAGTEGWLVEAGNFVLVWRTGRVAFEAGGTVQRFFRDERLFAAPHGGAAAEGPGRHDAGDYRIATAVRLTPEVAPALAVLRFGTRLPTTDNKVGLDRDQTDFFALLGMRVGRGALRVSAETGVGINGTRDPGFEQSDVWVYLLRAERAGAVTPVLTVTGHMDGLKDRTIRGNEELGELRLGLRAGRRRWVEAALVKGYTSFSPGVGVIVQAGVVR